MVSLEQGGTMKLWAHQLTTLAIMMNNTRTFDASDPGCVSADTEYLSPTGWKRIDQYEEGLVGQYHPSTRELEFVKPNAYIKRPCKTMVYIEPTRNTSQALSPEHRMLVYKPNGGYEVIPAIEYKDRLHLKNAGYNQRKIATTFSLKSQTCLDISDTLLALQVAVIADGYMKNNICTIRVKKARKKIRLRALLASAEVSYKERDCPSAVGFTIFRFNPARQDKEFTSYYWGASQPQLEIIAKELPHWDGSIEIRPSLGVRFSTTSEASANFAQYAFAANKQNASLSSTKRPGRKREYCVHARALHHEQDVGPGRKDKVYIADNLEGYKYCFEVPSTFLLLRRNGYIFATGNTGKTLVALKAFSDRLPDNRKSMLVIAPKSLMEPAWGTDIKKFFPHLSYSIANAADRARAFAQPADVYITNTDATKWLAQQPKAFFEKFDTICIDEIAYFKHRTSARTKALIKIKDRFEYRHGMTGTPNSNSITDIWAQMYIIDDGERLGKSFFHFRGQVCEAKQVGPSPRMVKWADKKDAAEAVASLVADITSRNLFEDCMDIPPNHTYRVPYTLNAKNKAQYEELLANAVLELQGDRVSAVNQAVLRTKLLQVAAGVVYAEGGAKILDTGRAELILDIVEKREHSIVFFNWSHQKHQLAAEADKRGVTYEIIDGTVPNTRRAEIVEAYQAGFFQTLFLHPKTGAHGLTLTKGTATIWASPIYEPDYLKQGKHRIYRGGQSMPTETILIEAEDTVEARVFDILDGKTEGMESLLALLEN